MLFQGSSRDSSVFIETRMTKGWITANLLFIINGKKFVLPDGPLKKARWSSTNRLLNVGPLRIELREPYRRWRVSYRGDLKDSSGERRFVHFQSWWTPLSDPFMFMQEVPVKLIAECAARTGNFFLDKQLSRREDFLQWGMFRSRFVVGESEEPLEIDFRGVRLRTQNNESIGLERFATAFMMVRNINNI